MATNKIPDARSFATKIIYANQETPDQKPALAGNAHENATAVLRAEVVLYIAQMSAELSVMARNSEMSLLSYFLDMAAAEARAAGEAMHETLDGSAPAGGASSVAPRD